MSLYNEDGRLNLTEVDGTTITGLYAADGSLNVYDATGISTYVGVYHPCGALNVVIVDGSIFVGRYATNGAINIQNQVLPICGAIGGYDVSGTLFSGGGSPATSLLWGVGNDVLWQSYLTWG